MIISLLLFAQLLFLVELIFLGIADLKYRVAAAVEIFFFGSVLVAILYQAPILQVGAAALSVAYGAAILPSGFVLPLLLWPLTWPSLMVGYGVRKELLGKGDLFAIGGISALYSSMWRSQPSSGRCYGPGGGEGGIGIEAMKPP